jgi:hypothetical protein
MRKTAGIVLLVLLFLAGGIGGYIYFSKVIPQERAVSEGGIEPSAKTEDLFSLRIYYPAGDQLQIEERRLPRRTGLLAIAEATAEAYLKGPSQTTTAQMPKEVKVLGVYKGVDGILYVDISDELRRNFQGDVFAEFLLLKGLYESLVSNVEDIQDVKVLIEGKEVETIGGHLYLSSPLRDMVSNEY